VHYRRDISPRGRVARTASPDNLTTRSPARQGRPVQRHGRHPRREREFRPGIAPVKRFLGWPGPAYDAMFAARPPNKGGRRHRAGGVTACLRRIGATTWKLVRDGGGESRRVQGPGLQAGRKKRLAPWVVKALLDDNLFLPGPAADHRSPTRFTYKGGRRSARKALDERRQPGRRGGTGRPGYYPLGLDLRPGVRAYTVIKPSRSCSRRRRQRAASEGAGQVLAGGGCGQEFRRCGGPEPGRAAGLDRGRREAALRLVRPASRTRPDLNLTR